MQQAKPSCLQCGGCIPASITKTGKERTKGKKYCSKSCRWKATNVISKALGRYYLGVASGICKGCSKHFARKKISNRDYGTYCSKECAHSGDRGRRAKEERQVTAQLRKESQHLRAYVEMLGRLFHKQQRPTLTTNKICKDCAIEFRSKFQTPTIRCDKCQAIARKLSKAKARKKSAQTPKGKERKRIQSSARRALIRGRHTDKIDPIKVLERDHWKCKQCGVSTPKALRGTHHDNAPELDHIIALADGGHHTWGNVQCLCRKCNNDKNANSYGQLGLEIAC